MIKSTLLSKKCKVFLFALVACSLSVSLPAYASSDYDDVLANTTTARVSDTYDNHTCTAQNIASSWGSYIMDDSKWAHAVYASGTDRETIQAALSTAVSNGDGWAVTEIEFLSAGTSIGNFVWGPGDHGVQVTLTPDANDETTFFAHNGINYATMRGADSAPVYTVILGQYWNSSTSSCSIGVAVSRLATSDTSNSNFVSKGVYLGYNNPDPGTNYIYRQLLINSSIDYPTGYEGIEPATPDISTDSDEDGLAVGYEVAQGTLDTNKDTDGDGIDDLK